MVAAVLDTSVAFKWYVRESHSEIARALATSGTQLLAPDLIVVEMANAMRKAVAANVVTPGFAGHALVSLRQMLDLLIQTQDLVDDALNIAIELRHPIYDCIYLAAARRLGAPPITADAAFIAKLKKTPHEQAVMLLADWKP